MFYCITCICTWNASENCTLAGRFTFTSINLAGKIILGICLCFISLWQESWNVDFCTFFSGPMCVCLFYRWECIQVFLRLRLTTPGDKGVKFSNFLYCSKVKNCRGKIRINELTSLLTYTPMYTQGHTLLKAATIKTLMGTHEFQWACINSTSTWKFCRILNFKISVESKKWNAHSLKETCPVIFLSEQNAKCKMPAEEF